MTEATTEESKVNSSKRIRSSFTMAREVMELLKAKAVKDGYSVSAIIEKAVVEFVK